MWYKYYCSIEILQMCTLCFHQSAYKLIVTRIEDCSELLCGLSFCSDVSLGKVESRAVSCSSIV
jgi:hypothetical protein